MTLLTSATAFISLIFVLAGTVKGMIGLGLPTVAMGLLSLLMPPAEAAAMLLLPSLVTNVWQLADGPRLAELARRLSPMLLAIFVCTILASSVIAAGDSALAHAGLGIALLIYSIAGLFDFHPQVSSNLERWCGPLIGALTGAVTGATGVFVIPAVAYLAGLGLARDELVQALGLSFTVSTIALAFGLFWHGALELHSASTSTLAIVPALLGMSLGGMIRRRVSPERFRHGFFVGLGLLALHIIWTAGRGL